MTPEEERNAQVSQLWLETWNNDVERMCDECYAADCEVVNESTGEVIKGREELRAVERALVKAFPDHEMILQRRIVSGDAVVMEVIGQGTFKGEFMGAQPNGRAWKTNSVVVLTFRDGQIISDHTYGDSGTMLAQLGLAPGDLVRELAAS